MEKQFQQLLQKMNEMTIEFGKQNEKLAATITANMAETMDAKLKPLQEENIQLKKDVKEMHSRIENLEREVRKNNILLHGVEEKEGENHYNLLETTINTLNELTKDGLVKEFDKWEISEVRRLGKRVDGKRRPILVKLTLAWRRIEILKNNKNFPANTYATEDFPKEVLKTRRELKQKQKEEIEKGNNAIIRYNKLIIKGKGNEKRKRSPTKSPGEPTNNSEKRPNQKAPNKINKTNAFDYMQRPRTNSMPETGKK
ncbi:hypothetical protein ABMA28_002886 [Loxostege sticticalis]|uniref:Endonuclease-reverse transcriptase n=1 Tax=Loxostege sticticalis TaxID=481309 RepID=A0ABD0S6L7_LOXSC